MIEPEARIDPDLKGWLDIIQERIEYLLSVGDYDEAARVILEKASMHRRIQ